MLDGFTAQERAVQIPPAGLQGDLVLPESSSGIVVFAHGSGSSRHSSRNRFVAGVLQHGGLATLLMDLLTPEEEVIDLKTRQLRFDIPLLARRLAETTDWLADQRETQNLKVGYFGASTGGGAALMAAADRPAVAAVVSRGGRPDLAGQALPYVKAPTLLIVGAEDRSVIALNEQAIQLLRSEAKLEIVPGATHLFEEPGTLEQVARSALGWFQQYLH
jgi:putative phosphoribosyl transferase